MSIEIKNLKKVSERIKKAIKNQEKIILYGDADLDGASSIIILEESIKNLGGKISAVYFPDRENEGYGLNEEALNYLKEFGPALLITLDCSIGNFKEAKLAKKLGFEQIIIDHHEVLEKLPEAKIIIDPKQKGDKFPFKGLSTAGIVFKLSEVILGDKLTEALRKNFLELTALSTLADMMPKEADNQIFIEEGLQSLENSWRPGIQGFLREEYFKDYDNLSQKVSKIISILNVRDVENRLPANYRLLTTASIEEAKKMIKIFIEKSSLRKEKIKEMLEDAEEKISGKTTETIVFEGDNQWELSLLSPVASIICHKYQKPTFFFKIEETKSQGAVRMPKGLNGVEAMKTCAAILETYGGHPVACGFRVKNENLEKFKECLIKYFEKICEK